MFAIRSTSPVSSTLSSSPPISPGCEDQQRIHEGFPPDESFKRPVAPDLHHPSFPPQFYNMYQPQLLLPNNSAFHRPADGSGKSLPVRVFSSAFYRVLIYFLFAKKKMPGFVPHLSNLELIRQAGIFYPRITDLTGKHANEFIQILISNYFDSNQHPITISLLVAIDYELFAFPISIHD